MVQVTEGREYRSVGALFMLCAVLGIANGCTYHPSFDRRASYEVLEDARDLDAETKGPIAVEWSPRDFPDRVDEIGPAGAEGAATTATIPTGVALSSRTIELLDEAIGVSGSSDLTLTIEVRDAESEYRYAPGFIPERYIDEARCALDVGFQLGDDQWNEQFVAQASVETSGVKGNDLLELVWDEIAISVVESIVANLPDRIATPAVTQQAGSTSSPRSPSEPVADAVVREAEVIAGNDALTVDEKIEALRRILLRRGLITEQEWESIVAEIMNERTNQSPTRN